MVPPVINTPLLQRRRQPSGLHQRPPRRQLHQQDRRHRLPLRQGTMALSLARRAKAPSTLDRDHFKQHRK